MDQSPQQRGVRRRSRPRSSARTSDTRSTAASRCVCSAAFSGPRLAGSKPRATSTSKRA